MRCLHILMSKLIADLHFIFELKTLDCCVQIEICNSSARCFFAYVYKQKYQILIDYLSIVHKLFEPSLEKKLECSIVLVVYWHRAVTVKVHSLYATDNYCIQINIQVSWNFDLFKNQVRSFEMFYMKSCSPRKHYLPLANVQTKKRTNEQTNIEIRRHLAPKL